MKIAALDLGSNTFICLICEVENNRITTIYEDVIEFVRLAEGMQKTDPKQITADAFSRAELAFQKFQVLIEKHKPQHILGMGTSATRDAANKDHLIALGKKYGIPIEAIPGHAEAAITNQGALSNRESAELLNKKIMVVDIGGGSTEFILSLGGPSEAEIVKAQSYDIGCVRIKEKFHLAQPVEDSTFLEAQDFISDKLTDFKMQNLQAASDIHEILAVAGTPTTLAMAQLKTTDVTKVEGFQLSEQDLNNWLIKTKRAKIHELVDWGVPAGRADVILVGIITLLLVLKKFNKMSLTVSTRGVRHGIALLVYNRHK